MLNAKTTYIKGLLVLTAVFGLVDCSKKSKSDNPIVNEQDDDGGGTTGGGSTGGSSQGYFDPTTLQKTGLTVTEQDGYEQLSSNKKAIFTGAAVNNQLKYTDAIREDADSSLMQALKQQLRMNGNDELEIHKEFARTLTLDQVIINPKQPTDVRVNFHIKRDDHDVIYSSTGSIKNQQGTLLSILKPVTGPKDVVVSVQCMDADETCHNVLVIFNDKSQHQVRKAFAVFRSTPVKLKYYSQLSQASNDNFDDGFIDLDLSTDGGLNQSPVFFKFNKMLQNSKKQQNNQKFPFIQNVVLESSSVVFGRSTFALFARIKNKNSKDTLLPIFGSLVRPQDDNQVNRLLQDPKKVALNNSTQTAYDPVMNGIKKYSLLQNDGRGSIQVLINFGADQQDALVILTITRLGVQLRALND